MPPEGARPAGLRGGPRPRWRCRRARPPSLTAGGTQPPPLRARSGPAPASRGRCCPRAGPRAPRPIGDCPNGHASYRDQSAAAAAATPRGNGSRTAAPYHVIEADQSPPPVPPRPGGPRAVAGGAARWRRSLRERRSSAGTSRRGCPRPLYSPNSVWWSLIGINGVKHPGSCVRPAPRVP